jgi:hypothetical protein
MEPISLTGGAIATLLSQNSLKHLFEKFTEASLAKMDHLRKRYGKS